MLMPGKTRDVETTCQFTDYGQTCLQEYTIKKRGGGGTSG